MSDSGRYTQSYNITWEQLQNDARRLAGQLMQHSFKGIIAITRGGLVPAAILARELDIRLIETLCLVSYDGRQQDDACVALNSFEGDGEGWLVIDDLVDSGKTMAFVRKLLPRAFVAVVYAKPKGIPLVDAYITEFSQNTWVLFPWDAATQFVAPLVTHKNSA